MAGLADRQMDGKIDGSMDKQVIGGLEGGAEKALGMVGWKEEGRRG